ncbi:hypothetical protein XELAEV_18019408mg [Xenopus laevis]|uniref:Olfactory receptor n=1 Tax=Xenopus laevis TaxID=8355 RepID=A0A974DGS1_XENLA|nr:hypothetical protein XELAEV_18019408mg [Xenopus laevis]
MISLIGSNKTTVTHFILRGINGPRTLKIFFFIMFLTLYIMTLCGNLLITGSFLHSQQLGSPMYFFLSHLSLCDILLSASVVPKLLSALLKPGERMTIVGCIVQVFASGSFTGAECNLLTAMSYDRYLAICNPLHYINIMNTRFCFQLVTWSWCLSLLYCLIIIAEMSGLEFCSCNIIDYIYCDVAPLLHISCKDSTIIQITTIVMSLPAVISPFLFVIVTYVSIFITILRISSNSGRKKAFSTCSSHLTVVCTYYGILIAKYTIPSKGRSLNMNKAISLLYTVVTPLINPIIYSFRNKEIRETVAKIIYMKR